MEFMSVVSIEPTSPIAIALAAGVLYLVRLALAGRVPDKYLTELAVTLSTALLTVINLTLGLVPTSFEPIAASILNLLAVLVGSVFIVNGYRFLKAQSVRLGFRF